MTSPYPAQGSPSDSFVDPEADGDVGVGELFGPPLFGPAPRVDEVFPAAMFAVPDTAQGAVGTSPEVMAGLPPGHPSGPMQIVAAAETGVRPPPPPPPPPPPEPRRRRHAAALLVAAAVVLAGSGGVMAYAAAHKTVTLDVDGTSTIVETFQGDVAGLLADEGVELTGRDSVAPGRGGTLREGTTVVVRSGHEVTLRAGGERETVWVTALDVDQALATLSEQDEDVVLLPAVSGGTATLPMQLDADGPVNLVVGGETRRVADGATLLHELLAEQGVRVDADDRIIVARGLPGDPDTPTLTVLVKEVQTSIEETVTKLPYDTVTATDPDRYEDLGPYLATEGVTGKRVTSWDVTAVDGKVVDKEKLSTWVAQAPVDEVYVYGTKARPAPEPDPEPEQKPERSEKPEKSERSEKPEKSERSDRPEKAEPKPEPESKPKSDGRAAEPAEKAEPGPAR